MLLSIIKYPAVWLGLFRCLSSSVQHFLFTTLCGALGPDHAGGAQVWNGKSRVCLQMLLNPFLSLYEKVCWELIGWAHLCSCNQQQSVCGVCCRPFLRVEALLEPCDVMCWLRWGLNPFLPLHPSTASKVLFHRHCMWHQLHHLQDLKKLEGVLNGRKNQVFHCAQLRMWLCF